MGISLHLILSVHVLVTIATPVKDDVQCNHVNPKMLKNPKPLLSKARSAATSKNLKLNYFKIVESMALKLLHRNPLECHHLPTIFHENIPVRSKVIIWGHRQTDG